MAGKQRQTTPLLYNSSIIKTYIEYLEKYYPATDIDNVLKYTGVSRMQIEDPGYFYDQETSDRFHDIIVRLTSNPDISREAGRFVIESKAYSIIRTYIRGFFGPGMAYNVLPKIHARVSRAAHLSVNSLGHNKLEVIAVPAEGVSEKPYQCQNRYAQFEMIAAGFTGSFAEIEHTECIHNGGSICRYIVSWNEPLFLRLERFRNYSLVCFLIIFFGLLPFVSYVHAVRLGIGYLIALLGVSACVWLLEKEDYKHQITEQARAADMLITETTARYNDAQLIKDLGQAISRILDTDTLLSTVTETVRDRLAFERGIILLANDDKTRLVYRSGYGLTPEQEEYLRANELHLDKPESKGPFVRAFREQEPFLIDDVGTLPKDLSDRSIDLLHFSGSRSFICCPIVFEDTTLGVLAFDRVKSDIPLQQNDLNLIMGIAPQIAISINNARAYDLLEEKERNYRDLVEGANSIIIRLSRNGEIKFANSYALSFYGYAPEEVLGKNIREFIIPAMDTKGRHQVRFLDRFFADPDAYSQSKNESLTKSGERKWVNWSSRGIRNKSGELVEILCIGIDITAWMQAEEERAELEENLIKSQKMEAIGTLAGGVAHDLNNILSGITSYPDLLLIDMPEDAPARKALMTIKKSGERAAAIVNDLLTLARRSVNVTKPVDLNQVIEEYFNSPEFARMHSFHPNVEIIARIKPDLKPIIGSEVHLMKTVMNLVSNAAEAMTKQGKVIVSTDTVYLDHPLKGYPRVNYGEYLILSVSDTGIGISEEDQEKIFEPFFTKKSMGRSGTGLGMTVVWSTVKDHKGYIEVESEEGKGTNFTLYFPVTDKILKEKDADPLAQSKGAESVMIVDDEEYQRSLSAQILSRLGYIVKTAKSGEEALLMMQDNQIDLLILDMLMEPGIDGLDTFKRAQEMCKDQKAIIVSGYSETDRVKEALNLGVSAYIKKPYNLQEFAKTVRRELDKKTH